MADSTLLIGGASDGMRAVDTAFRLVIGDDVYLRATFSSATGHGSTTIYVHRDLTQAQALERLVDGYRPA